MNMSKNSINKYESQAKSIFDYLAATDRAKPVDIIIGFGVFDMRVPEHCAKLFHQKYAAKILFTGGVGSGTGNLTEPEAIVFKKRALELDVPQHAIWTEYGSTNTLENILYSIKLMKKYKFKPKSAIIVAQPYRQRRVWLTYKKFLPDTSFINSPPPTTFNQEVKLFGGLEKYLSILLGEIERIIKYGKKGDILQEDLPEKIQKIYQTLSKKFY